MQARAGETRAVEARAIRKNFFGTSANEDVDLVLGRGEVHALLGENGAGKSTLCSILSGLYRPDGGEVLVDGEPVEFRSPRDALAAGIGMVYQHFRLVDRFTVAENLALGHAGASWRLSEVELEREAAELAERYGMPVDPRARIYELSVGEQQRVEILKLLHRGVRVLILDEPTAVLTPKETDVLFEAVRGLAAEGRTVVFVSHKLREVLAVADRVTVLRDARKVGEVDVADADAPSLARMMIGRDLELVERDVARGGGASVLAVHDVHAEGDRGTPAVRGVSFEVRAGEILGVAGVAGNGQRELAETLAGLRPASRGRIVLNARDATNASAGERIRYGLAFVPEDRLEMGVAAGLPLDDNLVLKSYRRRPFSRGPLLNRREIDRWTEHLTQRFDIRGARDGLPVGLLSGGNLQRAILAREIAQRPNVLVAASPTRGLDVAATGAVRRLILEQRDEGTAVLLISEDLDEIRALADRVIVMYEGEVVGEMAGQFDAERVGLMMAGHRAAQRPR